MHSFYTLACYLRHRQRRAVTLPWPCRDRAVNVSWTCRERVVTVPWPYRAWKYSNFRVMYSVPTPCRIRSVRMSPLVVTSIMSGTNYRNSGLNDSSTITSQLHHEYITAASRLGHHYVTVTYYVTVTSRLRRTYITNTSRLHPDYKEIKLFSLSGCSDDRNAFELLVRMDTSDDQELTGYVCYTYPSPHL